MELYQVCVDNGRWFYVWAAHHDDAKDAVESWGTDGKVVSAHSVDPRGPVVMGPI